MSRMERLENDVRIIKETNKKLEEEVKALKNGVTNVKFCNLVESPEIVRDNDYSVLFTE